MSRWPSINSFSEDHPEFAVLRPGTQDPGTIRFNHAIHLKRDLRGPSGNVTLICSDCHRAGNTEPWPYGRILPSTGRKYMDPVNYSAQCSGCHPLTFDRRFAEPAPHGAPETIHPFLVQQFTAWIAAHPEELRAANATEIRIPGVGAQPVPRTPGGLDCGPRERGRRTHASQDLQGVPRDSANCRSTSNHALVRTC